MEARIKNCFFKPKSSNTDVDEFNADDAIDNIIEDCDNEKNDDSSDLIRKKSVRMQCRMFLAGAAKADIPMFEDYQSLKDNVISRMRSGIAKSVIENDQMILKFRSILLNKIGSKRHHLIAQRMRQLGRLLVEFRQLRTSPTSLYEILDGQYFDQVIKATKVLCKAGDGTTMNGVSLLGTPSIGLHIGHSLKKCALIKQGIGLRKQRKETLDKARRFTDLFNAEWMENISSHALQNLKERRYNATELLPVTSDVLVLKDHSARGLLLLEKKLADNPSPATWRRLSEAVFTSVTLFNKRRGGEVAKMHTSCFVKRPSWRADGNEDILRSLSPLEKRLLKSLDMVHLPGERDRKVPLLLEQEWVKPMQLLVEKRADCGVESEYYFGVPGRKTHLSPWKVLNDAAINADCKCPDLISTTRLKKYTSTVTQVLGLKEGELEWLSNHMGHTVDIHRQSYRLHESIIEMAKVSTILLAKDSG
ncbi:uncharacterized protein LOC135482903 [Lineus longissimus]|uniref:uncharacterized protein LOC135482903 n=1 Tax=Lineus longissimus TaxID=88925 RepID=UPI00315D3B4E